MGTAVYACERSGDAAAQVMARRYRAHALARQQRLPEAQAEAERALDLAKGDPVAQAWCERMLAFVLAQQDRLKESYEHDLVASGLFKAAGHRTGQALALNSLGLLHANTFGEYELALQYCLQAQRLYQQVDHKLGEAATWDHLGYTYRCQTAYGEAIACYRRALSLYRELNDVYYQALMLQNLGDVHQELGDRSAARSSWQSALTLLTDLNHPTADDLHARLSS
jgi:tetratricopeptide (TPR) repeat protein